MGGDSGSGVAGHSAGKASGRERLSQYLPLSVIRSNLWERWVDSCETLGLCASFVTVDQGEILKSYCRNICPIMC